MQESGIWSKFAGRSSYRKDLEPAEVLYIFQRSLRLNALSAAYWGIREQGNSKSGKREDLLAFRLLKHSLLDAAPKRLFSPWADGRKFF